MRRALGLPGWGVAGWLLSQLHLLSCVGACLSQEASIPAQSMTTRRTLPPQGPIVLPICRVILSLSQSVQNRTVKAGA